MLAPWCDLDDDPDADLRVATKSSPAELFGFLETAIARSQATATDFSLDNETVGRGWDGETRSIRWLYLHMIEEYARHLGHADFLRESIDGRTGD